MSGDFTFLKGNIETIILCSLYNANKYGYEIAKEIKERTNNMYEIKQPTLYSYLKRLEEDDLIVSYWGENSNGGRRRYYSLTKTGKANCEQFISEWQYQRTVLSDLVDGTASGSEITQEEATPLFGRRSARRVKRNEYQTQLDEQDEIARRLRELTGEDENADEPTQETVVAEPADETVATTSHVENVELEQQSIFDTTDTLVEQTDVTDQSTPLQETEDDARARFDVQQDSAEDFLQNFEERAREVSERPTSEPNEGENYQHVLMGVLGDQLDGVEQIDGDSSLASVYYEDRPAALEDVADSLAKEGIRMRIYNHATANYKSKTLIPHAKVLCQTAWLTYVIAFVYFGVMTALALTLESLTKWLPYVITVSALLVAPIGFSVYAILDPTRKDKPPFNFRVAMIVSLAVCLIIVLAAIGISVLGNIEFSNFEAVAMQILIPTGIAILIPAFILIYYLLYKKY